MFVQHKRIVGSDAVAVGWGSSSGNAECMNETYGVYLLFEVRNLVDQLLLAFILVDV
jgi:hypothetical protein